MYASTRGSLLAMALTILLAVRSDAQPTEKLLIVHADDLGMAHSIDAAAIKALETGTVNSASIMVPCPWFPEIAAYARRHPDADFGLHLTLTSEWISYRWRPLLGLSSLVDARGYLNAAETDAAARMDPRQAEAEIRAQIGRARAAGIHPTHLDSHMGTLYQNKELFEVFLRVARDEGIPARISRAQAAAPFRAALLRPDDVVIDEIITIDATVPLDQWVQWYSSAIKRIRPGITEIVFHPAYDDSEMQAITAGHPHWGAAWRQRDFDFFTSDEFRRLLHENNIRLVTWREVNALKRRHTSSRGNPRPAYARGPRAGESRR